MKQIADESAPSRGQTHGSRSVVAGFAFNTGDFHPLPPASPLAYQSIKLYTTSIEPILPFFSFRTLAHDPIHRIFTGSTRVKWPPKSVSGE